MTTEAMFNYIFLLFFLTTDFVNFVKCACPCENEQQCDIVKDNKRKEVFIFSLDKREAKWSHYDWSKVTTVVMVGYINLDLMCFAHKHGARAVLIANYPKANLTSATQRSNWVKDQLNTVQKNYLDGINFDFEDFIAEDRTDQRDGYTALVNETYQTFKQANKNYQVSVDVAWSPVGVDQRFYDYLKLSYVSDFLFIMSYDEQSQIYGECIAGANSGFYKTESGFYKYYEMGADLNKLVLGVPWYGYIYQCESITKDNKCAIKHVPFRGINCSDAAGSEINYSYIMSSLLPKSSTGRIWDKKTLSPYFNFVNNTVTYQIWYDDPESLVLKYNISTYHGLRGVGMWNADAVDFQIDPEGAKKMWDALPVY
ncbi:di-N-acetylchitobiase-like [Saccostrea cucullata]|uniref:di-N-acetylchitobiase-like n=1 Tax=Saccostrea cuccullata TaxID=36930 RepID=UPI002ED038E6